MKPVFSAPRKYLERKPPHGAPCTRCGLCCMATKCGLGRRLFGDSPGPCPALCRDKDDNSYCGVIAETEGPMQKAAELLIGSGLGCDARFNGEPKNEEFYKFCEAEDKRLADQIAIAKQLWEMPS